jgi:uncharacterized membrane protein YkvA (DUF1232 family)
LNFEIFVRLKRMAFERSKKIARSFKRELLVYQRVLRDERTPLPAKWFLALAVGYFCMPFDLIPDFIPVIGHLDDAIIVPALVFAALRLVPREIVSEHREQVVREQAAINRADSASQMPNNSAQFGPCSLLPHIPSSDKN